MTHPLGSDGGLERPTHRRDGRGGLAGPVAIDDRPGFCPPESRVLPAPEIDGRAGRPPCLRTGRPSPATTHRRPAAPGGAPSADARPATIPPRDTGPAGAAAADRGDQRGRLISPREAAFTLALLTRAERGGRLAPGPGARALSAAIRHADPADCLDAAFAGAGVTPPGDLHARIRRRQTVDRPMADEAYYGGIARWLGVAFRVDLSRLVPRAGASPAVADAARGRCVPVAGPDGPAWVMVPEPHWLPQLAALACLRPDLAARIVVAPPFAIAAAFPALCAAPERGRLEPLHAIADRLLADRPVTAGQAGAAMASGLAGVALFLSAPASAAVLATSGLNAALLGHAATRLVAARHRLHRAPRPGPPAPAEALPVYSVLVPLFREAAAVPQLVEALAALDYPADRLDIQFLVEACDRDTLAALMAHRGALPATVTVVPDGTPRTKPRALNAGLKRARGSLVTVFDAEDRPEPDQLRKAAAAFTGAPPDLGALQAHLVIDHADDSWITRMFAIEYAALFDGILPMMSDRGWFFLLGGTSNHFRRDVLLELGGWDPYNVTEDADLAVRLRRAGYRLGQLRSATYEEAPLTTGAWLKQRTRWFKGWMQTFLVHNRNPVRMFREMGLRDGLIFHTLVVGAFLAVLAHPWFCALLLLYAAGALSLAPDPTVPDLALFAVNASVFVVGYGATFWLGALALKRRGLRVPRWSVLTLPFYWFLMAFALALALVDLLVRPHHWAKTRHGLARRPGAAPGGRSRPDGSLGRA